VPTAANIAGVVDDGMQAKVEIRPAQKVASGTNMDQGTHNKIVSFLRGIADDVLRDLFKRGKYPDVILQMCVLRRLDAVLEPTKKAVLDDGRSCALARAFL
jgi:hypothetical protein